MKKYLIPLFSLLIITSQASATTSIGLKDAFDELNYSLSVEWNQEDQDLLNQQKEIFADRIEVLKANGLTNNDLEKFAISQIKNKDIAEDARQMFSMLDKNKLTGDEALSQIVELANKSYAKGASWSGRTAVLTMAGVITIYVVVCLVTGNPIGGIIVRGGHGQSR